jgi:molecular chaperone GrpE
VTLDHEDQHDRQDQPQGPVIRDKRRIDPETGQVREGVTQPAPESGQTAGPGAHRAPGPATGTSDSDLEVQLAERTADLQRVQAEYLNYKRRVDRDKDNVRQAAVASTLTALLPVLDDIARAREHDELTGGFKAVAESLEKVVTSLGLTPYGETGEPFDPRIHDALMHAYSDDVEGPVCQAILQVGYSYGDRILRPARVAVAEPAPADTGADAPDAATDEPSDDSSASEDR